MKRVILSYDYELFFGDLSGTVQKTLITPTEMLLEQFAASNLKATFFVDYLMIKYLRLNLDKRSKEDLRLIETQIQDIVKRGHRIELHIHPHWVDAKYNGDGTWDFSNFTHYSLSSFPIEDITKMFIEGVDILEELAQTVDSHYKIVAFRAGGWAVQPISNLLEGFRKTGIKIDSSACYGIKNVNDNSQYDFTLIPNKSYYRFSKSVDIEDRTGQFVEFPITSCYRNLLYKIADRLSFVFNKNMNSIADGTHYRKSESNISKPHLFNRAMVNTTCVSTITALSSIFFTSRKLVVVIDHPKDLTRNTLYILGKLSNKVRSTTYYEYYNNNIK